MSRTSLRGSSRSVHPHGRGDNWFRAILAFRYGGSPPRAWGQCTSTCTTRNKKTVHPHGRGDNFASTGRPVYTVRFTPTGVGTIMTTALRLRSPTVHPHGRGDNYRSNFPRARFCGSPPRAWGQSHTRDESLSVVRFTPTGVGTMQGTRDHTSSPAVHPHGRGDNVRIGSDRAAFDGSPPRAWGQFMRVYVSSPCLRFTPTGVGTITAG